MWFRVWLVMVDVGFTTPTCPGTISTYFSSLIRGAASVCHLHISATSND
jgi:spore maturation protein SpmA